MSYSKILPAPGTLLNMAGVPDLQGLPAPGFSGVDLQSNYEVSLSRSRASNRGVPSTNGGHFWSFSISYHEMEEDQFTAIESFLLGHNTRLNPFYVVLPNYAAPRDSAMAAFAQSNTITTDGAYFAGDSQIVLNLASSLLPGCYINFDDPDDALHKSVYKVARVETAAVNAGVSPGVGKTRITIFPPLQREMSPSVPVRFINPTFRVLQTSTVNPSYDKDNMISFSFTVEEILP